MIDYVMFGHGPLFGDIVDIIRANGGRLRKVVQNIPEQVRPGTKPITELIEEQARIAQADGCEIRIEVEQLDDFTPRPGERYLIGFRSHRLIPLREEAQRRWGLTFPALLHPSAVVSPTARIGEGTFIAAGAIVGSGCSIGRYALLNRGCTIGHDCVIEDFANVGPGANLASFVTLRRCATVGIGATLINWVEVGLHSVIGAGAVVTQNVAAHTLAVGVPAQPKKQVNRDPGPDSLH